jgi:flagellar basal-body rod protein FlgB
MLKTVVIAAAPGATKCWRAAMDWRGIPARLVDCKRLPKWRSKCFKYGGMLDPIAGQLERYMDLLSARQKLVASNIANADTPGYHTEDIDFQSEFQNAAGLAPRTIEVTGLAMKNDGNNVSLDRESRLLSENALRFQLASSLLRSEIQSVREAIKEGQSS